jgi:AcrR family transcriptional regulator
VLAGDDHAVTDGDGTYLRNRPRQARSAARVEVLLDAAARVFEDVGYDAATTNLVATRAGVPVGTLYRWFPDKAALADALADRYLDRLVGLYDDVLVDDPDEPAAHFVRRVSERLIAEARTQRALPALLMAALVPGGRSNAGARLRAGLVRNVQALLDLRIPGVNPDIRDRAAEVCVSIIHFMVIAASGVEGPDQDVLTDEYIDVLLAYLEAKFPAGDHPVWSDPEPAVRPLFAAQHTHERRGGL